MKRILLCLTVIVFSGCVKGTENIELDKTDATASVSSNYEYQNSTYTIAELKEKLKPNQYGNITPSVSISTVSEDNTPNVGIFIPSIITIDQTDYLSAWFSSDTTTYKNLKTGQYGTFLFNEYDSTITTPRSATNKEKTELKLKRNKGCRVLVQYVGDTKQDELYKKENLPESFKANKLLLRIIKIYPLG